MTLLTRALAIRIETSKASSWSGYSASLASKTSSSRWLTWRSWARNEAEESDDKVSNSGRLAGVDEAFEVPCSSGGRLAPNGSSSDGSYLGLDYQVHGDLEEFK
ncbi:hypothetical protein GW17_00010837 [Ensete ventricosum]|nr:hypothetical protein GW17_00010837 [Ensete ventricosum]